MSFPDMRGVVGGAHFTAASEHTEGEREVLRTVSSHLSGSDVKLEGKRRQVVEDVMELFCSRPTPEIFERSWKKDAVFAVSMKDINANTPDGSSGRTCQDPLSKCHGYHEYAPQWYGLAKLFPKSKTLKMNVISSTHAPDEPNRIVYEQEQEYTLKLVGHKQVVRSLVVIDLDENDMITKLEDKWDGKDLPSSELEEQAAYMASAAANFAPAVDRNEVHRSAKALEQINTLFHDYCHATSVTATVQKKLAKALKEASNVKGTHPTAANTFSAAATIFEGVGEVQAKFAKICEREYEALSSELKKWFKKMNKEDRQHDELVYSLQAKLKSTTQGYEKKMKGRFMESTAASDHSQYINTLNNLTAELSQAREIYSESLSSKHVRILLITGGAVGRVGSGEWVRCCESVRRAGVAIAKVDEWRAYCEVPYPGAIPNDLPDIDEFKASEQSPVDSQRTGGRPSLDAAKLNSVVEEPEIPPSPVSNRVNGRGIPPPSDQPVVENADGLRAPVPEPIRTDSPRGRSASPRPLPVVPSPNGSSQHLFPPAPAAQVPSSSPPAASSATGSPTMYPVSPPAYASSQPQNPPQPSSPLPPKPEQLEPPVQSSYPFPQVNGGNSPLLPPDSEGSQLKSPPQSYSVTASTVSTLVHEETPRVLPAAAPKSPPSNPPSKVDTYRSAFRRESYGRLGDAIESPRPTHAFVPPPLPPPLTERTGRATRSNSIESVRSGNSHVAAMRERYGDRSQPMSPAARDTARLPGVSSLGSRAATGDAFAGARPGPPPSAFASPSTERTSTRKLSFEFGERDRIRDRPSDPDTRDRPRASLPARDREREGERSWGSHTRQRSRDWADEQDIPEDRDREGTRRRREEDVAMEERMNLLRDRERELEKREREIGRREQQHRDRDYVGDRDRRDVPVTPGRRERDWDRPREREYDPRNVRSQEPLSPTPRRTYSPPMLSAASRSTNALQQTESSGSKGHASNCGCHDCSARLYAMPSPRSNPPPQERPERNDSGERQRYLASNDRFASSTASLSNTSPNVSRTSFPQMKSTPGTPGDSSGTETDPRKTGARRSVFANLRRLSMGGAFSGGSDAHSSSTKTPSIENAPPSAKWKSSPSTIPESEEPSSRPLSMVRGGLR
ncbi:hypothetical protein FRC01_000438 [Tulasnella sp. 417]|nr:hypothetical protein FRC01_000438 [Tulasnella sp. 417]